MKIFRILPIILILSASFLQGARDKYYAEKGLLLNEPRMVKRTGTTEISGPRGSAVVKRESAADIEFERSNKPGVGEARRFGASRVY